MNWEPIQTAPKDGTWILGVNNRGNQAVIIWAHNAPCWRGGLADGWIHPFSDGKLSAFWNGGCGSEPTHWMQLPRFPAEDTPENSKLESLTRTLHAIAITLGLDTWEDLPVGDVPLAVEKAVNAKVLAGFVRGQRSARAAEGVDPDALPEAVELAGPMRYAVFSGCERFDYGDKRVSVLCESEEQAEHMTSFWAGSGYYEPIKPLQSGAPELLTRAKILGAVHEGYHKGGPIVQDITDSVCELLSSGGAVAVDSDVLPELLTHKGISTAVAKGLGNDASTEMVLRITHEVCELLSLKGARVLQTGAEVAEAARFLKATREDADTRSRAAGTGPRCPPCTATNSARGSWTISGHISTAKRFGNMPESLVTGKHGLMDTTCHCGGPKAPKKSFCMRCYKTLNVLQQANLYRRIDSGYEAAHVAALETLKKNGRVQSGADGE